jgi:hypothetical protein
MAQDPRSLAWMRILLGIGGSFILLYAGWALWTGSVISTWASTADRSSPIYWITVVALVVVGMGNVLFSIFGRWSQR